MNCFSSSSANTNLINRKNQNKQPTFKIPTPNYDQLVKTSKFNKNELLILFDRYCDAISNDSNGLLSKSDFVNMPELLFCPISSLIFDKSTKHHENSLLSFPEYIDIMNIFSLNTTIQEKAQYLNYIAKESFSELIVEITQTRHIPEDTLVKAIDESWNHISIDNKLNQKEFNQYLCQYDLHSILTIQY